MGYLLLSVLSSTLIFVIFKLYDVYKIQTLYAIITNYVVACLVGLFFYEDTFDVNMLLNVSWIWGPIALGLLFIVIFNLMAKTAQVAGVSVASVATKMSLAIPVIFGIVLYGESLSLWQLLGVLLALVAVYLASLKSKKITIKASELLLPLLVFLGSGIIDTSMKYFEEKHLTPSEVPIFSSLIFGFAALFGLLFMASNWKKTPIKINFKNVLGGIVLGVPNYFSIYFLILALQSDILGSSAIFTLNNVAIVLCSTLLGILLFQEKLSLRNWMGVLLALVSIMLVALF